MRRVGVVLVAFAALVSLSACPLGSNKCDKDGQTKVRQVPLGEPVNGKQNVCTEVTVCSNGTEKSYINDQSCRRVDVPER